MLSVIWSKQKCSFRENCDDEGEGLKILTKLANGNSNIVIKPIFLLKFKTIPDNHYSLKSCHLCNKPLTLDKEIYMYRGDLGFCSVGCRDRQIYLDETKELEMSTQKILSSFRQRRRDSGGRCETSTLSEEFRRRRHPFSSPKSRVVFS